MKITKENSLFGMYENGYILLPRDVVEMQMKVNRQSKECNDLSAFIILLMKVNHTNRVFDYKGEEILCKRGESVISLKNWAKMFNWTIGRTRRFFDRMERLELIEVTPTGKGLNRIRVIDYDELTCRGKNERENLLKSAEEEFELFWELYHEMTEKPKQERKAALKEWKILTAEERRMAIVGIENYANTEDKRYYRKAHSYLRDGSYLNEEGVEMNFYFKGTNHYEPEF